MESSTAEVKCSAGRCLYLLDGILALLLDGILALLLDGIIATCLNQL
jgi:hypothetical protein